MACMHDLVDAYNMSYQHQEQGGELLLAILLHGLILFFLGVFAVAHVCRRPAAVDLQLPRRAGLEQKV